MPHFKKRKFAAPFHTQRFCECPGETFCPRLQWTACTILSNSESYCMATGAPLPPIFTSRDWGIWCNEIMSPGESKCPRRVKVSWNNPRHDELLQIFFAGWTVISRTHFGCCALASSAATRCARVAWVLIDAAEPYDRCHAQTQTRPIEKSHGFPRFKQV